jgi:hypothetical protein
MCNIYRYLSIYNTAACYFYTDDIISHKHIKYIVADIPFTVIVHYHLSLKRYFCGPLLEKIILRHEAVIDLVFCFRLQASTGCLTMHTHSSFVTEPVIRQASPCEFCTLLN